MLSIGWPSQLPVLDARELRRAIARRDADAFLAAVTGRDVDDALQQVGAGVPMTLEQRPDDAEPVALSVVNRLTWRGEHGDEELAEDLLAHLRGVPLAGRALPVDLDVVATLLAGDPALSPGGWLDLRTGEVLDPSAADPAEVGEDVAVDVEAEPDRWLVIPGHGSREGWDDMAAFARRQRDPALQDRLGRALDGRGAFRRFRDLVEQEELTEQWRLFVDDRRWGRARAFLAAAGIRVG